LVAVMVCLLVVLLMSAALVQGILAQSRQARVEQQQLQACWLAESALDRALAQLRTSSGYAGEEWRVTAEQGGEPQAGTALIRVQTIDDDSRVRLVTVAVFWPDDPVHRFLEQREFTFQLPEAGEL